MAVEYMLNISLNERFDSTNSNTMKIIEPILKISSTDPFVHLYGEEIFRTLNFKTKVFDQSLMRSKEIFKALAISEEN